MWGQRRPRASHDKARCARCEQFGHYTYECTNTERIYKTRPSRTQQLQNPKLLVKLADTKLEDTDGVSTTSAAAVLAAKERSEIIAKERGDPAVQRARSRSRSVSTAPSTDDESRSSSRSDSRGVDGDDERRRDPVGKRHCKDSPQNRRSASPGRRD